MFKPNGSASAKNVTSAKKAAAGSKKTATATKKTTKKVTNAAHKTTAKGSAKNAAPKKGSTKNIKSVAKTVKKKKVVVVAGSSKTKGKRQTKLRVKAPPIVVVDPPEFNPIVTDLEESELQLRLFIREYILRFEKHCGLSLKHLNVIDDVTGPWTDMTFKTVIVSVIRIIYSDNYPVVDGDLLKNAIKEIEKTASHNELIWQLVSEILANRKDAPELTDEEESDDNKTGLSTRAQSLESTNTPEVKDYDSGSELSSVPSSPILTNSFFKTSTPHLEKLKYIVEIIKLSLTGSYIRETLDIDNESLRRKTIAITADIKAMGERQTNELNAVKETLKDVPKERKEEWKNRLEAVKARCDKEMHSLKEDFFRRKRKLSQRTMPIGVDIYGNQYWLFSDRMKSRISWGSWIMCSRAQELLSPTGKILFPKKEAKKEKISSALEKLFADSDTEAMDVDQNDDALSTSSELSDTLLGNNNNWYAIETKEDAEQLVKWIKYTAEVTFGNEEKMTKKALNALKADPDANSNESDSELVQPIVYDDFIEELYNERDSNLISPRKRAPRYEMATRESIDVLAKELQSISAFLVSKEVQKARAGKI